MHSYTFVSLYPSAALDPMSSSTLHLPTRLCVSCPCFLRPFALQKGAPEVLPPVFRRLRFSAALEEFYAPHNARLYKLLGKDYGW